MPPPLPAKMPPFASTDPARDPALKQEFQVLRRAIAQAKDVADKLEHGQARMPLRDHFAGLTAALDHPALSITLLGLDAHSRSAACHWLCGGSPPLFQSAALPCIPVIEID